jgi:predicted secreted protein
MRQAGIDPNIVNNIIDHHPAVQAASQVVEQNRRQQIKASIDSHFKELLDEHPDCGFKSVADFVNNPKYPEMLNWLNRGYTMSDAYEKVNKAEIKRKNAEAAKQATLNKVNSKEHLKPDGGTADVDITTVPKETLAWYKSFFPKWTNEQIAKHYKNSK